MKACLKYIYWIALGIIFLYTSIVLTDTRLSLYFIGILACIYGVYRISIPLTKNSQQEAEGIKEQHLAIYSKKSGLLSIAYGIFIIILLSIYDTQNLHDFAWIVWFLIITCSCFALSFYLKRKYKETNKYTQRKNRFANNIATLLLIYVLFLIIIAIFPNTTKDALLFHSNINASDIIYEYKVDSGNRLETTFIIYLKNDEKIGFTKIEPRNINVLFPFLPIKVYAYSVSSKSVIDIVTGNITITLGRGVKLPFDKNAKNDDIRLEYFHWHREQVFSSETRRDPMFFYMGIKHEFIEIGEIKYKFTEYFYEIFDGIYIYFFVSHEQQLDSDLYF